MVALMISIGAVGVLVSLFALGFGFANNGFDVGNTLIIAGASGLGSSLVLIALAVVVRELRRLVETQSAQQLAARPPRPIDPPEPLPPMRAPASAPRASYPPKQPVPEPAARDPRVAEPRPMAEPYVEPEMERPRPNIFAAARGEPPMAAEPDMLPPMPPRPVMPPSMAPPPPAIAETPYEPKFGPADILARLGGGRGRAEAARDVAQVPVDEEDAGEPSAAPERPEPPRPETSRPARGNMFESMWPADKPARSAEADAFGRAAAKPEPRPEPRFEPKAEPKPEPRYEPKRPRAEPPPLQSAVAAAPPPPAPMTPAPADARTASILKSGVIDGMAYTLYTDGSIEAQLPQGTVRFASIEELRVHLEHNA